jgi:hypothetical protein
MLNDSEAHEVLAFNLRHGMLDFASKTEEITKFSTGYVHTLLSKSANSFLHFTSWPLGENKNQKDITEIPDNLPSASLSPSHDYQKADGSPVVTFANSSAISFALAEGSDRPSSLGESDLDNLRMLDSTACSTSANANSSGGQYKRPAFVSSSSELGFKILLEYVLPESAEFQGVSNIIIESADSYNAMINAAESLHFGVHKATVEAYAMMNLTQASVSVGMISGGLVAITGNGSAILVTGFPSSNTLSPGPTFNPGAQFVTVNLAVATRKLAGCSGDNVADRIGAVTGSTKAANDARRDVVARRDQTITYKSPSQRGGEIGGKVTDQQSTDNRKSKAHEKYASDSKALAIALAKIDEEDAKLLKERQDFGGELGRSNKGKTAEAGFKIGSGTSRATDQQYTDNKKRKAYENNESGSEALKTALAKIDGDDDKRLKTRQEQGKKMGKGNTIPLGKGHPPAPICKECSRPGGVRFTNGTLYITHVGMESGLGCPGYGTFVVTFAAEIAEWRAHYTKELGENKPTGRIVNGRKEMNNWRRLPFE